LELLDIEVFDALVLAEFSANIVLVTNLALYNYPRALSFDMIMQLYSVKMLELIDATDVAAVLRTVEL